MAGCDFRGCDEQATAACRFGDGLVSIAPHVRQTFVHYCGDHLEAVEKLFTLCDVRVVAAAVEVGSSAAALRGSARTTPS